MAPFEARYQRGHRGIEFLLRDLGWCSNLDDAVHDAGLHRAAATGAVDDLDRQRGLRPDVAHVSVTGQSLVGRGSDLRGDREFLVIDEYEAFADLDAVAMVDQCTGAEVGHAFPREARIAFEGADDPAVGEHQ